MNEIIALKNMDFAGVRQDIHLVYALYFDYLVRNKCEVPSNLEIIAAFGCLFFCKDIKLVSGYTYLAREITLKSGEIVVLSKARHTWLSWLDENYIIDLVPLDGMFGISVPQAIIQTEKKKRFFSDTDDFHTNMSDSERVKFGCRVEEITNDLEEITKDTPIFK